MKRWLILICLLFLCTAPAVAAEEHGLGHHDIGITIPSVQSNTHSSAYTSHVYSTNIPETYDLRDIGAVTSVKDQGKYDSCWAFGVINALESNAIMQELETADTADFSELQLLYFYYNRDGVTVGDVLPEFAGLAGDNIDIRTGESYLEAGGNIIRSGRQLSTGMGVVDERYAPYSSTSPLDWDNETIPPELTPRLAVDYNRYILSNVTYLSLVDSDMVKQYLMDVGCGAIIYYQGNSAVNITEYNGEQSTAYFQNEETSPNHCVGLVGWDDNYPKENFLIQPEHNGAWLVKNSWGEEWGDSGYFWISYEDTSLCDVVFYEVRPSDEYDSIYQYDGAINTGWIKFKEPLILDGMSIVSAMNVFTAADNETITHVSFETLNTHVTYDVIVRNESKEFSGSEVEGTLISPGYYTVELTTPVSVQKGEMFLVGVAFGVSDNSINVEGGAELLMATDISSSDSTATFTSVSKPMESLWFNGADYVDAYDMHSDVIGQYNFRIKAFTVDAETPPEPTPTPTPDTPAKPSIEPASIPENADVTTNTVAETNALTKAEIEYQISPTSISDVKVPTITRGSLSTQLSDAVKVMKILSNGTVEEIDAEILEDGSVKITGSLDDAQSITINFIGRQFGDVTADGKPDTLDAARVLQASVGLYEFSNTDTFYGDVSGDGKANTLDAARILQYSVGLVDENYMMKA